MGATIGQVMTGLEVLSRRFGPDATVIFAEGGAVYTDTLKYDHEELTCEDVAELTQSGWSRDVGGAWEIGV